MMLTEEERVVMLQETLYFFRRYRSAMATGAMAEAHLERLRDLDDVDLDNRLSTIEWAIHKAELDFEAIISGLPERATVIVWLEIALRDMRTLKETR